MLLQESKNQPEKHVTGFYNEEQTKLIASVKKVMLT